VRAAKVDRNQAEVVAALRKAGCTVQLLHRVGQGCPDLLVARGGVNVLIEVKDGKKPPSERKLTADQVAWHRDWRGAVYIVNSQEEALAVMGIKTQEPMT
jgi:Holliday junction resolvase